MISENDSCTQNRRGQKISKEVELTNDPVFEMFTNIVLHVVQCKHICVRTHNGCQGDIVVILVKWWGLELVMAGGIEVRNVRVVFQKGQKWKKI